MFYFIKTPWLVKKLIPFGVWDIPDAPNTLYLSFDDGPHPTITPFVLDLLKKYQAKATFFCIGKNVMEHRKIYESILEQGHAVGNHTQNHLNGWKTPNDIYIKNIEIAQEHIKTNLFRPPYGRIKNSQSIMLKKLNPAMKIIMWDILSADFDVTINAEKCISNVLKNIKPGAIIVFHDSEKAFPRLQKTLPVVLAQLTESGFVLNKIPENLS